MPGFIIAESFEGERRHRDPPAAVDGPTRFAFGLGGVGLAR
jgi:hypothetical protein